MRRAIVGVLVAGLCLCWGAFMQAQGIQYSGGYLLLTGGTLTGPLLLPDGSAAAPAMAFASEPTLGIRRLSANVIAVNSGAGSAYQLLGANGFVNRSTLAFSWSSGVPGTNAADLFMVRDAAATLQHGEDAATATAQIVKGPDSTGANVTGAALTLKAGAGTSGNATGGQLILQGGANAGTGEPGAVAVADGGTKPTCAAGIRGSIWYDAGGAGVADTFEVCAKQAAGDSYAWRVLATIP